MLFLVFAEIDYSDIQWKIYDDDGILVEQVCDVFTGPKLILAAGNPSSWVFIFGLCIVRAVQEAFSAVPKLN